MMTTRRSRRFQPAILGYDHLESRRMLDASVPPPVDTPTDPPPSDPTAPTDTDFDPGVIEIDNEVQTLAMNSAPMPMTAIIAANSASTAQTLVAVIEAGRTAMNNTIDANVKDMNLEIKEAEAAIDKAIAQKSYYSSLTVDGKKNLDRLDADIALINKIKSNIAIEVFELGQAKDTFNAAVDGLEAAIKFFSFPDDGDQPAMGLTYYTNDELDYTV